MASLFVQMVQYSMVLDESLKANYRREKWALWTLWRRNKHPDINAEEDTRRTSARLAACAVLAAVLAVSLLAGNA